MGDDDDDNNNTNNSKKSYESDSSSTWDFAGDETQVFDSQIVDSPISISGNKVDDDETEQLHNVPSTIPFDDTVMFEEDDLVTQLMDPDGETQLFSLGGETQVVNFDAEVEEMDIPDSADNNNETQLFNDCDTEEVILTDDEVTEKTEVVDDSDDLSDEDSGRKECDNIADMEHALNMHQCKEEMKDSKSKSDCGRSGLHTSGVGFKTFTSIRTASMRAFGLAALSKASRRSKSPACPLTSEPDIEHTRILSAKSQSQTPENQDKPVDGLELGNICRFGRSTARKLFAEDAIDEIKGVNGSIDPCETADLAGLSYIDSQEPGDASQANALNFVDNFLKINIECDNSCGINKATGGKSKPVLSAKGAQSFAKSASLINAVDERRVFEWEFNHEDEEGEFFIKNKEVFFASAGRQMKSAISSGKGRKLTESDSKLVLAKNKGNSKSKKSLGTHIKDVMSRENLNNKLDRQSTYPPSRVDIQETVQETTEVRFDTQMAADAMEDLCLGLQGTAHESTKADSGCSRVQMVSHKSQIPSGCNGVITTRYKSMSRGDQSMEVKRASSVSKKNVVGNDREKHDKVLSNVAKRRGKVSLKRREVNTVDQMPIKKQRLQNVSSADQMLVKKQCMQNVTPVARRTRQYMKDNKVGKVHDAPSNSPLTGFPKGKRTSHKLPSARQVSTRSVSRLKLKPAVLTEQAKGCNDTNHQSSHGNGIRPLPERSESNLSACTTPSSRGTPIKESSPICKGDEYLKQSCRRLSLIQEVMSLSPTGAPITSPNKETRKRKDVSMIRVLFSRHLDGDIIKQQKKILTRLGASESLSMSDATHFIADDFVRTRNMLEAIAFGKPVVTHLWLESCGQACCHIDEKNFILKDAKKEKEFGFSLPASLARARQNPLLKGHKVLITPNTKPGKEILSSLVKAVHGVAVERMGRSGLKDSKIPVGLLILSCEEDYAACVPFLEKGAAIYSSELLLNGIVTQRLEYERHRLFVDHVKRTRSTIWLKKDDNQYKPVGKVK
uniref:uncharacterized protein LOC122602079 isoform X2 n=1 Tax=Erigeron canadensis TaxID=72917 RepID=UPI001CB8E71F|nr:uncharacterized protein LOC122602079 isoform X2 [Erigeron canadensis]